MDILTLEAEATSAQCLARHGVSALERLGSAATQADPVLACLALASEKMLKMTIGMTTVVGGDPWPDRGRMQGYGHKITKMNRDAMSLLLQRVDEATRPPVVTNAALASVDVSWMDRPAPRSPFGLRLRWEVLQPGHTGRRGTEVPAPSTNVEIDGERGKFRASRSP